MIDSGAITLSFDLAAQRCSDITPLVYERLFMRHPDMEPLFVRDTTGSVRGEMLFRVIEAIFDFIGPRAYSNHLIETEVVTHEGYGVPREIFGIFFETLAETLRDLLGGDWTPAMEQSWRELLTALADYVANPERETLAVG